MTRTVVENLLLKFMTRYKDEKISFRTQQLEIKLFNGAKEQDREGEVSRFEGPHIYSHKLHCVNHYGSGLGRKSFGALKCML